MMFTAAGVMREIPGHYVLYGESDNLFHSEFGMDAASCEKSLKKFLPQASLHPTPMSQDPCWQHHGEWWGTYFRDCEMFGSIEKTPENLGLFTRCSQYMQGGRAALYPGGGQEKSLAEQRNHHLAAQ